MNLLAFLLLLVYTNLLLDYSVTALPILSSILNRTNRSPVDNNVVDDFTIFEGDIVVRSKTQNLLKMEHSLKKPKLQASSAVHSDSFLWPRGVIPFEIDPELESQRCLIQNAMLQIMMNTCIRFRPKTDVDFFYLKLSRNDHYSSCLGSIGRELDHPFAWINLPTGCHNIGIVVHELMHVIGFNHQQKRNDRNEYVKVNMQNVHPSNFENFDINDPRNERILTPWDYQSIMLYGPKALSKDGNSIVMEATHPGVALKEVMEKPGLSRLDVVAIRLLYNCPNYEAANFEENYHLLDWLDSTDKICPEGEEFQIYKYLP